MTDSPLLLALDFGGTKLSAGVARADPGGLSQPGSRAWEALERTRSPQGASAETDLAGMWALARRLLAGRRPAAIGVSFGGPVDAAAGRVILSHHVPGWEAVPLCERLETDFGAPARMDNDANAAAWGEWCYGTGWLEPAAGTPVRRVGSLFYVTVSTGVGGGWVLNNQIWRGADSMAGEIGHIVVQADGPACVCGKRGCVEALAAGPNLARRARERLAAGPGAGQVLRELAGGRLESITAEHVARAAGAGDRLAGEVLAEAARALGLGLASAITLMNPERVVLGGGVTKSGERYWQVVRAAAREGVLPEMSVDIRPAALGDDAPLWGAAALAEAALGDGKGASIAAG